MRYVYHKFLLLCGMQIILFYARAQQPYSIVHYDENLLPQTTVGNIQQDDDGYLWMNTQFGIVRFDGEKVRVFTTDNLKGLTSNRIRICAKGFDKSIYFVDEKNVIIKVISPNQFETMKTVDCIKKSKVPLYARECNNDFGYLQFNKKTSFRQLADSLKFDLTREFLKVYVISEKKGYFFYEDTKGNVKLCYYDAENFRIELQNDSFKAQHTFKLNNLIFNQTSSSEAQLFLKGEQKNNIQVTGLPAYFTSLFKEETPVLFSNESGAFFYASGNLYEYKLSDKSISATLVFKNLPCIGVVNVMKERTTGDFMISTKSTGFYRVKKKRFGTINLTLTNTETPGSNTSFNNNIIYTLNLWDRQHIFCSGYITPVTGTGASRPSDLVNKARVNYFFQYPKDNLHVWLNFNDSIQSFNKKTGRYTPLLKIFDPKKVVELSSGATIIVAAHNIVALQNNIVTQLYRNDSIYITTAERVTEDCIVVGTANGLYYFYLSQKRLQAVRYKEALTVRFIYKDKSARLWFTTYGQGLFYLSGNSIIPLPVDNAGYLAIGHSIVEDNSGYFWIPTNHGLFRLGYLSLLSIVRGQSSKLYYTYFDKTDGFNTNEFNGGCFPSNAYQKETGLLFFPSMDGVVKFNPDSIKNERANSAIFFDEVISNDTGHVYPLNDKLYFPSQTSSISIYFSSPYYGHKENIKYSYTISNVPGKWKDLGSTRNIVLSNLPGGSYTIIIKKEEATGVPILATFSFTIQKNFSETIFFKLLLLALVVGLIYLSFRARLHYLGNERDRLEKEVAARTTDQMKLIDHKEKIIAVLIHDIKSPLYFLNSVAEHLNKNIELNPLEKNKEISNGIATSLNSLYLLTQDFSIWLNASQPGHIQEYEKVALVKIIEEALEVYKEIIDKKDICIQQAISTKFIQGDEPMIKSVIRNLIDNAIKNTTSGSITITCRRQPNKESCEIIIADEGKGMTAERTAALNHFFQSGPDTLFFSTSGFGHKVIKDFLQKLGGAICYRPNSPSGIIVTVTFPVINPSTLN